jgi:hypothetical protein
MTEDLLLNTYYFCFNSRYICVLFYISNYIFNDSMVNDYLININANYKNVVYMHYLYRQYHDYNKSKVEYNESL